VTLVSNAGLEPLVREYGGRPFVLPDAIPSLPDGRTPQEFRHGPSVLVVSSFASDEPYREIIAATAQLDRDTTVYVTGNQRGNGLTASACAAECRVYGLRAG